MKNEVEAISYLMASCDDLPDEAPVLRKRVRARSTDRGHFFQFEQGLPISGPKTEEEAIEDQRMDERMECEWVRWTKNRKDFQAIAPTKRREALVSKMTQG
jgi:hypothetical protein